MTVGAVDSSAKGDRPVIVHHCGIVSCCAMTNSTTTTTKMPGCASGKTEVDCAVAGVTIIFMDNDNQIGGAGRIMTCSAGRGIRDIALCQMIRHHIKRVVGCPIPAMTLPTIDADATFSPIDLILIAGVVGVVARGTGNGAVFRGPAHML